MAAYGLSKSSVLKLLEARGVAMRRQAMTQDQIASSVKLYEEGVPLAAIMKELEVPRESVRRALISAGVQMRNRGRSAGTQAASVR
jgi:hypothetical protein